MDKIKYSSVQCQSRGGDGGTSWQQEREVEKEKKEEEEEEKVGAIVVNWMILLWNLQTSVSVGDFHSSNRIAETNR